MPKRERREKAGKGKRERSNKREKEKERKERSKVFFTRLFVINIKTRYATICSDIYRCSSIVRERNRFAQMRAINITACEFVVNALMSFATNRRGENARLIDHIGEFFPHLSSTKVRIVRQATKCANDKNSCC